jgi:hypothetical protein
MLFSNADINSIKSLSDLNDGALDKDIARINLWQTMIKNHGIDNFYLASLLKNASKKKNILIGSFDQKSPDIHKTLYGEMNGPTILLNIYYDLLRGQNDVKCWYIVMVFVCFFLIFFRIARQWHNPYNGRYFIKRAFGYFFIEEFQYIILVIMTLIANIVFHKVTNLIILAISLHIADKIVKLYNEHIKKKKDRKAMITKKNHP